MSLDLSPKQDLDKLLSEAISRNQQTKDFFAELSKRLPTATFQEITSAYLDVIEKSVDILARLNLINSALVTQNQLTPYLQITIAGAIRSELSHIETSRQCLKKIFSQK